MQSLGRFCEAELLWTCCGLHGKMLTALASSEVLKMKHRSLGLDVGWGQTVAGTGPRALKVRTWVPEGRTGLEAFGVLTLGSSESLPKCLCHWGLEGLVLQQVPVDCLGSPSAVLLDVLQRDSVLKAERSSPHQRLWGCSFCLLSLLPVLLCETWP